MTELEMTSLLIKLGNMGVTGIVVKYDGGGDSGAIEWIGYTNKPCETTDDVEDNIDEWSDDWRLSSLDSAAYLLIEDFANSNLLDNIEDWWNNEGGWGTLSICVPSGVYSITSNIRVTHSETFIHTGSLTEQSAD